MIVSSVRWVCLWWGASRINTCHCVQTWPQTAQTLQLFKNGLNLSFPQIPWRWQPREAFARMMWVCAHVWRFRAPEAQMTCQVEMEQKCPREVTQSGQEVFHWEWIYSRLLMGYILYLYFCYLWVRGWVSCLSHGDRSGHPQSCNQGLFVCGWDWDTPGAAWRDRAGF